MRFDSARHDSEPIEIRWVGRVDYQEMFDRQHELATARADGTLDHDVLLLLEHPAVFTAGRRTEDADRPTDGSRVIDVDRGGRITWHGPGQLVGYPIVRLAEPMDVVDYVRRIEQALIMICGEQGLSTMRVEGRSGVWVDSDPATGRPQRKTAAIGVRVARGVTLHGFALNCDPDLTDFGRIVPCGIPDAGVTSLSQELGRTITIDDVRDRLAELVVDALDGRLPVTTDGHPSVSGGVAFAQ